MKKKLKIALFSILYIFAYLFLCILFQAMYLWISAAFFLTLLIVWETDLEGPKLNRTVFIGLGIIFLLTIISFMITSYINGDKNGILAVLIAFIFVIITCFGGGILFWYYHLKKQGKLDVYESYKDIMAEEEFNKWQERKHKND